jgi:hypothetical protein
LSCFTQWGFENLGHQRGMIYPKGQRAVKLSRNLNRFRL